MEKIDSLIPDNLEVVWGLVRPKSTVVTPIKEIIVCAFYCPPKSRKKTKLMDHLITNCHVLLTKYPNAGLVIGGDKNEWKIGHLIASIPKLKQIVSLPTCNLKTLDVILTNLWQWYSVPVVVPPVPCDDPSKGVPSDHSTPVAHPLSNIHQVKNVYVTKTKTSISDNVPPSNQVLKFQEIVSGKIEKILPEVTFRITQQDKP